MLDNENPPTDDRDAVDQPGADPVTDVVAEDAPAPVKRAARKIAAKKTATKTTAKKAAAKKTTAKRAAKKAVATPDPGVEETPAAQDLEAAPAPRKRATRKRAAAKTAVADPAAPEAPDGSATEAAPETPAPETPAPETTAGGAASSATVLFQPPEPKTPRKRAARKKAQAEPADEPAQESTQETTQETTDEPASSEATDRDESGEGEDSSSRRRSRRRGGRRRRKSAGEGADAEAGEGTDAEAEDAEEPESGSGSRRRRRRRRPGEDGGANDDPENTVTRTRKTRNPEDEITALSGSTRLEAKKQRRREGREAGRRRAPIVSEAEFLARRESVNRTMVIRQRDDLTQIAVLEDKVLVEHYVARASQTSLIGNVYLGRVQNVLPSMEAAFIDIGKGRNAVLYAGEVNWKALGAKDGQPRKVESVLSSGQTILVQVTKDPVGHKGARLTGQITLAGRFLVYVPDGTTSGISRKLPDTERSRLKALLREVVPDTASVIVRTAAEGASEDELTADVERLKARWSDIEAKIAGGQAPQLLYGEPDLTLKVVRDLFTEDFATLVIQGDEAWDLVQGYVTHVAPDLSERLERYRPEEHDGVDLFGSYRLDEQIAKGLDRKVWLPSGGSLIIDRTEAMTVVDVNTGKFTGSGGNLEETVTKNNLEAAEEIVRQLRLRDIGGIIVIDFIDMVLESNRDLVLRRLVECLGRDRTRHQVAEVTSLGLVQMTRKRLGTGLLEAFSEECEHCKGRGLLVHDHPIEPSTRLEEPERRGGRRGRGGRTRNGNGNGGASVAHHPPSPADLAAMPRHEQAAEEEDDGVDDLDAGTDLPATDLPSADDVVEETPVVADAAVAIDDTIDPVAELDPTPAMAAVEPVPDPAAEHESEPEPVPEPVDPGPRLVTSTRRRSARRAAGPPVAQVPEPASASASGTHESDESDESGESDDDAVTEESGSSLFHVPIKRKGARKR